MLCSKSFIIAVNAVNQFIEAMAAFEVLVMYCQVTKNAIKFFY